MEGLTMNAKQIIKDLFVILGTQMLVLFGWILMSIAIGVLFLLFGIGYDNRMIAAIGTFVISFFLYGSMKKRYSFKVNPFSISGLYRCWLPSALAVGGYILRCVVGMIAGGKLTIELATGSLMGYLLLGIGFTLLISLLYYVFSIRYLQCKNYGVREVVGIVLVIQMLYFLFSKLLLPVGMRLSDLIPMVTLACECVLLVLLFIRSGSLWGILVVSGMDLMMTLVIEKYTPALIAVELGFVLVFCIASYLLFRQEDREKTA